jgi:hypothetical protein
MPKKIILTEEQFSKLNTFIVETKFDTFIKNSAKVGDIIKIHYKNTTSSFEVLNNDMGQITMDCIDAGVNKNYRFFLAYTGLNGNKLQLSKVHKIKEKDKLDDVKSWKVENLNDVKNIELVRGDKVVDTVDKPQGDSPAGESNDVDFENEMTNTLGYLLSELKEGKGLVMKMTNNEDLLYCCLARDSKSFTLELNDKTRLKALNKWDSFVITLNGNPDNEDENLYELNKTMVRTKDGGKSFDILTKANSGKVSKNVWITGIVGFSVTPNCESKEEDSKDEKDKRTKEDELKREGEKAYEMILNDPNLKKAFYSQPNFWELFVAELKGEKATGHGIVPALKIINSYETKSIESKLGAGFIEGKKVSFKPMETIKVPYKRNEEDFFYTFDSLSDRIYNADVLERKLGEGPKLKGILKDKKLSYEIEIKSKDEKADDVFICDVSLIVKEGQTTMKYDYDESFEIKIDRNNSAGYRPKEKEQPKTK